MEQLPLDYGLTLRDAGAERVLINEGEWKEAAAEAVRLLAHSGVPFTAEEVREIVGDPERTNAMGAVFLVASQAGLIEPCGYRIPSRASRHANRLRVWKGSGHPDKNPG